MELAQDEIDKSYEVKVVTKKKEALVITLLSLLIFLLAFMLSGRLWFRLDMTRDGAYTISDLSRNLYREISDRVTITYFVSPRLAASHPMPKAVADLLEEYAAHSRGRIRFIQRDPAGAGLSAVVEGLGIIPWQIQVTERNETILATVYSGILIEYLDREDVIPLVFSLDTLEYDLTFRIRSLLRNTSRDLGIIVGDPYMDLSTDFSLLNNTLILSGFRPLLIDTGSWIPTSLPALFVLGGVESLDEYYLRPIDEYIQAGGNVLFALNGVIVDTWGSFEARTAIDMGLLPMLANYGVLVQRALVLDTTSLNLTFQMQGATGTQVQSVRYPPWIAVQWQGINQNHPVSSRALGPDFFWPSPLELHPPQGVNADVLFTTSREAWLQTENFITNPNTVSEFEYERGQTRGTKILAAALSGIFPGAFADNSTSAMNRHSRIIVAGDVNFAGPLMQTSGSEDRNIEFFISSAIWLSGQDDLLPLRNRGSTGRLDRVTDPEARDVFMSFSRALNTFAVPLAVIIIGFIIYRKRQSMKGRQG